MDKAIHSFFAAENNLTFCTAVDNIPYCANCFYAFMADENFLIIKSDRSTKHISNALINEHVAGTVIPDIRKIGTIKGIQFTGKFIVPEGELLSHAKKLYYLKHPISATMAGDFWIIEVLSVKMIDNTLGFGKKIKWEKEEATNLQS